MNKELEDEDIIPAGAVQVPGSEESSEQEPTDDSSGAEANPTKDDVQSEPENGEDDTYEIDGITYTSEELQQVLKKGKSLHEYQKAHPGFDPWLLERDYRIKTAKLSELEREALNASRKPAEQVDLSEFDQEEIERFEKIAKAKGLVSKEQLEAEQRASAAARYNDLKDQQLKNFLKENPQYLPENDPGDEKWNALQKEFNLFKMPSDPSEIGNLLRRAHEKVSGVSNTEIKFKDIKRVLAAQKTTKVAATASGGKSGGAEVKQEAAPKNAAKAELARQYLKGFSEEELKQILK